MKVRIIELEEHAWPNIDYSIVSKAELMITELITE